VDFFRKGVWSIKPPTEEKEKDLLLKWLRMTQSFLDGEAVVCSKHSLLSLSRFPFFLFRFII